MDKNLVQRQRRWGKLAIGSKAQKGSKPSYVNGARVGGKLSDLIRGDLPFFLRGRSQPRP
jgi:hypothetical protein